MVRVRCGQQKERCCRGRKEGGTKKGGIGRMGVVKGVAEEDVSDMICPSPWFDQSSYESSQQATQQLLVW